MSSRARPPPAPLRPPFGDAGCWPAPREDPGRFGPFAGLAGFGAGLKPRPSNWSRRELPIVTASVMRGWRLERGVARPVATHQFQVLEHALQQLGVGRRLQP